MATYYVGVGGNDGNSGLTWALRKLTLNGAEDVPVVADDLVYVGPGVYREMLTVDVDGGAGTEIVYVADVTGEHTDDVGGIVRITGSDNDQTTARTHCIAADAKDHRIFRGFFFNTSSEELVDLINSCTDWLLEDCTFGIPDGGFDTVSIAGASSSDIDFHRCIFFGMGGADIGLYYNIIAQNVSSVITNCLFLGGYGYGVRSQEAGGITIRNSSFMGTYYGLRVSVSPPGGFTANVVENCIFQSGRYALNAVAVGEIVEDYNTFYHNTTDRTNVNVGANSLTYPALFLPPILHSGASQISGFKFPWWLGELSEWSQVRAITGNNEPTVDLRGVVRPVTASKNSWGSHQFHDAERETGTVHAGSASLCLHDAGRHQIWVPVEASSTTISVYVYREANYAGNNPQMIVKQPGQADDVTTDANAASQWNLLTTTLTPAADPPYVIVELVSRNTAVAGNYDCFFDDLEVN